MFNLAIEWRFLEKNPCKRVKKHKEAGGKERFLNKDELKLFLQALDEAPASVSIQASRFLLFTGTRMSEALNLLWKDVDFQQGTTLIPDAKGGKARTITLNVLAKRSFPLGIITLPA